MSQSDAGAGSRSPQERPQSAAGSMPVAAASPGRRNLPGITPANRPSPPALQLDEHALTQAAATLGLHRVSAQSLRSIHTMGAALKAVGAVKVGRVQMLIGQENVQDAITQVNMALAEVADPVQKIMLLGLLEKLTRQQIRGGYDMVRTAEVDSDADTTPGSRPAPFNPGAIVSVNGPAQFNLGAAAPTSGSPAPPQAPPPPDAAGSLSAS